MNNRNFVIVVVILAVVALAGLRSYLPAKFNAEPEAQMADFPMRIGEWEGTDIPLRELDYEILETRNLIVRDYVNRKSGEKVNLYIIYSRDNRRAAHPPEICYTGGGAATITEKSVISLTDTLRVNKFSIDNKDFSQLVVYWFKSANFNTPSYFKQQLKVVTDRMLGKRTSSAMIRVSATLHANNQAAALSLLSSFCREIKPIVEKYAL